jgi:hypothetical protein
MANHQGPIGPHFYTGMHTELAKLTARWQNFRVMHVVQIEQPSLTLEGNLLEVPESVPFMLNERAVAPLGTTNREVLGITRIIAVQAADAELAAGKDGITHDQLHWVMRSWMINQQYMLDFGPSHCDNTTGCGMAKSDDEWYSTEYVNLWKRRLS